MNYTDEVTDLAMRYTNIDKLGALWWKLEACMEHFRLIEDEVYIRTETADGVKVYRRVKNLQLSMKEDAEVLSCLGGFSRDEINEFLENSGKIARISNIGLVSALHVTQEAPSYAIFADSVVRCDAEQAYYTPTGEGDFPRDLKPCARVGGYLLCLTENSTLPVGVGTIWAMIKRFDDPAVPNLTNVVFKPAQNTAFRPFSGVYRLSLDTPLEIETLALHFRYLFIEGARDVRPVYVRFNLVNGDLLRPYSGVQPLWECNQIPAFPAEESFASTVLASLNSAAREKFGTFLCFVSIVDEASIPTSVRRRWTSAAFMTSLLARAAYMAFEQAPPEI